MHASSLPSFADLPPVKGMPHGCAWGLFDKPSSSSSSSGDEPHRDQLGTLNLLTRDLVLHAAQTEIKTGEHISLDWALTKPAHPLFGRCAASHKFIDFADRNLGFVHDDELTINTQAGSQWDGFKHFAHQPSGLYYNNQPHSRISSDAHNLGIHHWAERGGIVGRGVLLDFVRYASLHGIEYHPMKRYGITVRQLEEMVEEQKVELRPGDVLIVRSGFTKWYEGATEEERKEIFEGRKAEEQEWTGVEGSMKTVEWLWDHHFAAVAGDCISWEQWPFNKECIIHEYQLAFWGSPIGEIWNLEKLAEVCEREKRWSFFFTSAPLNVPGGVASPPNAICIF